VTCKNCEMLKFLAENVQSEWDCWIDGPSNTPPTTFLDALQSLITQALQPQDSKCDRVHDVDGLVAYRNCQPKEPKGG